MGELICMMIMTDLNAGWGLGDLYLYEYSAFDYSICLPASKLVSRRTIQYSYVRFEISYQGFRRHSRTDRYGDMNEQQQTTDDMTWPPGNKHDSSSLSHRQTCRNSPATIILEPARGEDAAKHGAGD